MCKHFPLKPYWDVLRIGSLKIGFEFFLRQMSFNIVRTGSLVQCPEGAWNRSNMHRKNMSNFPEKPL